MVKTNYIRVGRLVRILRGPRQDRVGVIVDIVDGNRVLVENSNDEKMFRHVQNLKNVMPLRFMLPTLLRNSSTKSLKEALATSKILDKYAATTTGKRIMGKKELQNSTDFERYQLRVAKRSRAFWTRKLFDEEDIKQPLSWRRVMLKKVQKKVVKRDVTSQAKIRIAKAVASRKVSKK